MNTIWCQWQHSLRRLYVAWIVICCKAKQYRAPTDRLLRVFVVVCVHNSSMEILYGGPLNLIFNVSMKLGNNVTTENTFWNSLLRSHRLYRTDESLQCVNFRRIEFVLGNRCGLSVNWHARECKLAHKRVRLFWKIVKKTTKQKRSALEIKAYRVESKQQVEPVRFEYHPSNVNKTKWSSEPWLSLHYVTNALWSYKFLAGHHMHSIRLFMYLLIILLRNNLILADSSQAITRLFLPKHSFHLTVTSFKNISWSEHFLKKISCNTGTILFFLACSLKWNQPLSMEPLLFC